MKGTWWEQIKVMLRKLESLRPKLKRKIRKVKDPNLRNLLEIADALIESTMETLVGLLTIHGGFLEFVAAATLAPKVAAALGVAAGVYLTASGLLKARDVCSSKDAKRSFKWLWEETKLAFHRVWDWLKRKRQQVRRKYKHWTQKASDWAFGTWGWAFG